MSFISKVCVEHKRTCSESECKINIEHNLGFTMNIVSFNFFIYDLLVIVLFTNDLSAKEKRTNVVISCKNVTLVKKTENRKQKVVEKNREKKRCLKNIFL